jgi:hypothetical protein
MGVGLELMVEERLHLDPVVAPGCGDPALVVIGRRIGLAGRPQHDPAIELQRVEARPAQRAVLIMQAEEDDLALGVAERPRRSVRHVVPIAGVLFRREHDLRRTGDGQGRERWFRRADRQGAGCRCR